MFTFKSLYTMPVKVIYMMVITETCHFLDLHVDPVLLIREVNAMGKTKSQRSFHSFIVVVTVSRSILVQRKNLIALSLTFNVILLIKCTQRKQHHWTVTFS